MVGRVFISGVAGFLGSHLADICLEKGNLVVGCDNLLGGDLGNVPEGLDFHEVDCLNWKDMLSLTRGVDVVFHCAATAYEGLSSFSPYLVTNNIYGASVSLLSASIHNGVGRFVFCSSMARYGKQPPPFEEDMKPKPEDPYGIAKVAFEQTLMNLADTHNFDWSIAVPHNIIGPRQRYTDPYRNVASIFINRMLQGEPPIIYGDGKQKRCFSFVQDVAPYLYKLGFEEKVSKQIVNLGPDEEFVTINHLASTIAELLEFPKPPIYMPDRPREVREANCSSTKAREYLDYKTEWTLESGLREMIEWVQKKGPRPFDYHLPLEIITADTPITWVKALI